MNETYLWIKALHVIGFLLWTGALLGCLLLLLGHESAQEAGRKRLSAIERKVGIFMDVGALIAIVAGLYLALGFAVNWFKQGGWLHVKTMLVAVLVGMHVFTRIKVRKFRNGDVSPLAGVVIPLTLILITIIVVFAVVKPLR